MSEVKIEKLMCRTCLSTPPETDLRSIYEQSKIKENMRYIDMLQECASYNVSTYIKVIQFFYIINYLIVNNKYFR